jgi:hypothetical protein
MERGLTHSLTQVKVVPFWVGAGFIRLLGSQLHIPVSTWASAMERPYSLNKVKVKVPFRGGEVLVHE